MIRANKFGLLSALVALSACSARIHEGDTIWYDEGGIAQIGAGVALSQILVYLETDKANGAK